jgi:threonylcarbamoyladenosine tRNA methylthiotransferase CDKAL1
MLGSSNNRFQKMKLKSDPQRIYVEGHGCSASLADTEIIRGSIESGGYELVDDETIADLSILVTCTVKTVTEQRMLSRIRSLSSHGRKLIVAGCLPKANKSKVMAISPASSLLGPENLDKILPTVEHTLSGSQTISIDSGRVVKLGLPRSRLNNIVGIIEISSGCLSSCTFCQVKLVKGVVFSYPEDSIIEEARTLLSSGSKELWLTSTDNSAYGKDSKSSLPRLINRVTSLPGNFKVRVGMMNPLLAKKMMGDLIDCFKNEKIFKFLHLPVQSGSDIILKKMQRGYTVDDFIEIVRTFRRALPNLTLSTDMIVGFPTETEQEFEESMDLLARVRPDVVNISRFGARDGTKAAAMDGQVGTDTSKSRSTRMTSLVRQIQKENNSKWIGWQGSVLVDERVKNAFLGRNYAYKPCLIPDSAGAPPEMLGKEILAQVVNCTSSTLRTILQ